MASLYPHQIEGVKWLTQRRRAGLFDEAGLGKTITAIKAATEIKAQRILCVVPAVVLWNWAAEFAKWAPEYLVQVVETSSDVIWDAKDVVIVSTDMIYRGGIRRQLLERGWDLVIADEAHKFKTHTTQRSQAFYGATEGKGLFYWGGRAIVKRARYVWILTGTPTPNDPSELYPHFRGLWPELITKSNGELVSFETWRSKFCVTRKTKYGIMPTGEVKDAATLRRLLRDVTLYRRVEDVMDGLPDIRYEIVHLRPLELPAEVRRANTLLRKEVNRLFRHDTEKALEFLGKKTEMARFRRLCAETKVPPLVEYLRPEVVRGKKLVIFAHHRDVLRMLRDAIGPSNCVTIFGDTPAKKRTANVKAFQESKEVNVALCNIAAAGVGITLTAAHEVIFVELSYTPGDNAQAVRRCRRIGQTKKVRVRTIVLAGTIDEAVMQVLETKVRGTKEVWRC